MELEFHRWLKERLPGDPRLPLGLSDDAAVLAIAGQTEVVVTTDLVSDGVDFHIDRHDPRRIGRKALAVNLSDLAAMAVQPKGVVVSIALPVQGAKGMSQLDLAIRLYEGLIPLAQEYDVAIAGGDTNCHDGPLVVCVTAIGQPIQQGPLTRRTGRPGDWLLVTGELGGSILGRHFDFTPRVRETLQLHECYELHAGMDLSDGLALDLARLTSASQCGAIVLVDQLPISQAAQDLAAHSGETASALQHAMSDGEDFELLLAAPPSAAKAMLKDQPLACGLSHIGELIDGNQLWQQTADGRREPLEPKGWTH